MLTDDVIQNLAERLDHAEKTRKPTRHLSLEFPDMTIVDAYAVQAAWIAQKIARGRTRRGRKIGLTSHVMQQAAGISEPDYGVLLDDMFYEAGAAIERSRFIDPRIEVELCFVLGQSLRGPTCTIFDVLRATEYIVPALEVIDARVHRFDPETQRPRLIVDTVADNAASGAIVIGGRPIRAMDTDLRWVSAICYRNGRSEESGVAAAVLNHPANGVAWLANKIAPHGDSLEAGDIILAGSFTRATPVARGDHYHVEFGPLGSITCSFV